MLLSEVSNKHGEGFDHPRQNPHNYIMHARANLLDELIRLIGSCIWFSSNQVSS